MTDMASHDDHQDQRPRVVTTRRELFDLLSTVEARVGLVMTMGALHAGHLSLVQCAREHADFVVVSIFVNPTQFAPGEDFDSYPRTLDADIEALSSVGADLVFAPSVEEMYPEEARVMIDPGPAARVLEGRTRPTHFAGVCQVVNRVLNLVRPEVAVFGQKDAQQLAIIRQMVRDFGMRTEIIGAPIVRDPDGLAMSSRNAYLSADERQRALALSAALRHGRARVVEGVSAREVVEVVREQLTQPGIALDYVALTDPDSYEVLVSTHEPEVNTTLDDDRYRGRSFVLAVAARVGSTRLIDNVVVEFPTT